MWHFGFLEDSASENTAYHQVGGFSVICDRIDDGY